MVGLFVVMNLAVPLVIEDFFPFTTTPMFRDRPRFYSRYLVYEVRADEVCELSAEQQITALAALQLNRTYDGNPPGLGVGQVPPPTLDRFSDTLSDQPGEHEVRAHVIARLSRLPDLKRIEVLRDIVGPQSSGHVGVVQTERWRFDSSGGAP